MTLLTSLEQAVADADFSAIQQAVVELILQKDGHALSKNLLVERICRRLSPDFFLFCNHGIKHN